MRVPDWVVPASLFAVFVAFPALMIANVLADTKQTSDAPVVKSSNGPVWPVIGTYTYKTVPGVDIKFCVYQENKRQITCFIHAKEGKDEAVVVMEVVPTEEAS